MVANSRDRFLRRLGRALKGVNAVEYGRPVPTDDLEPACELTVDDLVSPANLVPIAEKVPRDGRSSSEMHAAAAQAAARKLAGPFSLVHPVLVDESEAEDVPYPPDLPVGAKVTYTGPENVRLLEHLVVEHPGMVAGAGEKHADVRWVDKQGWFVCEGVFDPRDLTVIDDHDFASRADKLRHSDWPGFSPEAPGTRYR